MLCQETPATSLTPTALIVQGYTRGGGGGEVPDSHIHFSGVFLFVWGFLGFFFCMPMSIYPLKNPNTLPNILQPSIRISTFTHAFYNPLLVRRYPSICSNTLYH